VGVDRLAIGLVADGGVEAESPGRRLEGGKEGAIIAEEVRFRDRDAIIVARHQGKARRLHVRRPPPGSSWGWPMPGWAGGWSKDHPPCRHRSSAAAKGTVRPSSARVPHG